MNGGTASKIAWLSIIAILIRASTQPGGIGRWIRAKLYNAAS